MFWEEHGDLEIWVRKLSMLNKSIDLEVVGWDKLRNDLVAEQVDYRIKYSENKSNNRYILSLIWTSVVQAISQYRIQRYAKQFTSSSSSLPTQA